VTAVRRPFYFEANGGRHHPDVGFLTRGAGWCLFLTGQGVALDLERGDQRLALWTRFPGASGALLPVGLDPLATRVHYLLGNDPSRWSINNRTFARVRYAGLWDGVDLEYRAADGGPGALEYDFIIAPGADPSVIQVAFEGAEQVLLNGAGELVIATALGDLKQSAPRVYQEGPTGRVEVQGAFRLLGGARVGFELGPYDPTRELVIDPVLSWAGFLGGSGFETINDLRVAADGTIYVGGATEDSPDLPITAGAYQPLSVDDNEGFAASVSSDGSTLNWCTYIGGDEATTSDGVGALDLDALGHVILGGRTSAPDFPTTPGAFQESDPSSGGNTNAAYIAALTSDGSGLVFGSFLGSTLGGDEVYALEVGPDGGIHLAGQARNASFPTTPGAFQETMSVSFGGFIAKFASDGTALLWSTLLASSSVSSVFESVYDLDVDAAGRTWFVMGSTHTNTFPVTPDAFQPTNAGTGDMVAGCLAADGSILEYATYLGGSGQEHFTNGVPGVAADGLGRMWVAGTTNSANYPVSPGALQTSVVGQDGAVTCIDTNVPGAAGLVWSTYFGGASQEYLVDVEVDSQGRAYARGIGGDTLPMVEAWDACGGTSDALLAVFDDAGLLIGSTFLGDTGNEDEGDPSSSGQRGGLRLDGVGGIFVFGNSVSASLATPGVFQGSITPPAPGQPARDGFIAKLTLASPPAAQSAVRAPCVAPAPPGSLLAVGKPLVGKLFTVAIADPTGATQLGSALTYWAVSRAPWPGYPCGLALPGFGAGGSAGEILIGIGPTELLFVLGPKSWSGPGTQALHSVTVSCSASLHGLALYTQGIFVSGSKFVLTEALDLVLGS
jgi:hypothetical protein